MRIVFCGCGDVAAPCLEALQAGGHEVAAVYTQPPRRAGRGSHLRATVCDNLAHELGLVVVQADDINSPEHVAGIRRLRPELIVVVDFGQKVGAAVRDLAPLGAINLHASLLPQLRGAAPVNWAILHGLTRTGVTTFRLVDRMDAGPILLQEALDIEPEETAEELRARLAALGARLLLRTAEELAAGQIAPAEQDESQATKAPKLSKADGRIDFAAPALDVVNRIRGAWPWPGAFADFIHADRPPARVIFARARALLTGEPDPLPPGVVGDDQAVGSGGGRVQILELKVAGKRLMNWRDFINGYRVASGDRFVPAEE